MRNFKFDIRNKTIFSIIISVIILCFIFLSIKSYTSYLTDLKSYNSSVKSKELNSARNASLLLSEMLNPSKILLVNTAKQLENKDIYNNAEIIAFLSEKALKFTGIEGIYFGRENDGSFFGSKDYEVPDNFNPRNRPWYKEAVLKNSFVITEPYIDVSTGAQCLGLAVPVYKNGILEGVLGADLPVSKINDVLEALDTDQEMHYSLFTGTGMPIILPKYPVKSTISGNRQIWNTGNNQQGNLGNFGPPFLFAP
jgi:methyl-accepting chemotaxis protein